MPSATSSKAATAGTKRKSAPEKSSLAKEFKKVKIDTAKPSKVVGKSKDVKKSKAALKKEESIASDSDDLEEDGGVPLEAELSEDESEDEDEEMPSAVDGLHPERAKAVSANGTLLLTVCKHLILTID